MAEPDEDTHQHQLYEGVARGGPLHSEALQSRYPEGILAVDKAAGRCWIYDYNDYEFVVREEEGRLVDKDRRVTTADEPRFDVQAVVTS